MIRCLGCLHTKASGSDVSSSQNAQPGQAHADRRSRSDGLFQASPSHEEEAPQGADSECRLSVRSDRMPRRFLRNLREAQPDRRSRSDGLFLESPSHEEEAPQGADSECAVRRPHAIFCKTSDLSPIFLHDSFYISLFYAKYKKIKHLSPIISLILWVTIYQFFAI